MRIGLYSAARMSAYKHQIITLFMFACTLFLGAALYSYNPHDVSWFYYVSDGGAVTNWCGVVGAQLAALLFYLFGASSFVLIGIFLFITYLLMSCIPFVNEWERIVGLFVAMIIGATLCRAHSVDFWSSMTPGGAVGLLLYDWLHALCDDMGSAIVLYAMLSASLVIILRFSFMRAVHIGVVIGRTLFKKQYFIRAYVLGNYITVQCIWKSLVACGCFIKALLDGSALQETDLLVPHDENYEYTTSYDMTVYNDDSNEADVRVTLAMHDEQDEEVHMIASPSFAVDENQIIVPMIEQEQCPNDQFVQEHIQMNRYTLPNLNIFVAHNGGLSDVAVKQELETRAHILEEKLKRFGIVGSVVEIKRGPVVTLFEYQPAIDTKLSKILALGDDLAMALQALSIRILAPIPGTCVVGFEVANKKRHNVLFADIVQSTEFTKFSGQLPLVLGKDTIGKEVVVDLSTMPHLLIAGSTGSGKSVALNVMLVSLLCRRTPQEVRLILIDPKRLEFASYADIAHLLFPIVTDPKRAAPVLRWVVKEMENRYEKMAVCGVRSVRDYNLCNRHDYHAEKLPYIVITIDELSDLMMTAGREIEDLITRITQMARAAGIHMIVATQRPSVDVITGLIKVNFPSRISFRVTSKIDSRTILDCVGADKLLGRGDMLFLDATTSLLQRVHGAYLSNREIEEVVCHIRAEQTVSYLDITEHINQQQNSLLKGDDQLYEQVLTFLEEVDEVSISLLQRKFRIGYNRSARIIDLLENSGMILPADGGKTRKVVR